MSIQQNGVDERRRVKVYELRVNDWFDRGTGFCMPQAIHDEAKIHIEAEDDPNRDLLELMIKKEDAFQKQQETLIVWTDQNGIDMALSFQEAEGCGIVWSLIGHVQQRLSDGNDSLLQLPAAHLDNLDAIEDVMRRGITTQQARETILKLIFADIQNVYISKLTALVSVAEDLESLPDLHRLCNIMKTLILFNDSSIIEFVVRDDQILGFVGALEYDPDFPHHKANHRQFLSDASKFREVVPMPDPQITQKIHYTYRLQYLKDVVLARILDDPTFNVLNSLIFFNQVDIVQHIQADNEYLTQLVQTISSPSSEPRKRRDGVLFIQQSCAIAKGLQAATRTSLFRNLIDCGLFNVITCALQHPSPTVRVAGTDILVALIDHDALMVRSHIISAVSDRMKPMTETLIELLHIETDLGVKAQIADAMKVLLDCTSQGPHQERMGEPPNTFLAKFRVNNTSATTDAFLDHFYNDPRSAKTLFGPLRDLKTRPSLEGLSIQEVSLYSHLIEILSFIVRQPKFSRAFILEEGLVARVAQLMKCPDKHLKLSAIKYLRVCLSLNDPDGFHRRQMIQYNLFEPVIDMVEEMMPRDNLLSSAGLEMFEFIRRENIRHVVFHLVENYRHRLDSIRFVDTFRGIIIRYEEFLNPPPPSQSQPDGADSSFMTSDAETPNTRHVILNGGDPRWQAQLRDDLEEDSYFDGDDVEDELAKSEQANIRLANGFSPHPRPLVNYDDDDDEDEADDDDDDDNDHDDEPHENDDDRESVGAGQSTLFGVKSNRLNDDGDAEATVAPATPRASQSTVDKQSLRPPSSLSEKRQREEDDEDDELRKLSQVAKRRNSGIAKKSNQHNGDVAQPSDEPGAEQSLNSSADLTTDLTGNLPTEPPTPTQNNDDKTAPRMHGLRRGRSGSKAVIDKRSKIAISLGTKDDSKESNEAKG